MNYSFNDINKLGKTYICRVYFTDDLVNDHYVCKSATGQTRLFSNTSPCHESLQIVWGLLPGQQLDILSLSDSINIFTTWKWSIHFINDQQRAQVFEWNPFQWFSRGWELFLMFFFFFPVGFYLGCLCFAEKLQTDRVTFERKCLCEKEDKLRFSKRNNVASCDSRELLAS